VGKYLLEIRRSCMRLIVLFFTILLMLIIKYFIYKFHLTYFLKPFEVFVRNAFNVEYFT
jgi:hypothetical protein